VLKYNLFPVSDYDMTKFYFVKGIGIIYMELKNGKTFELIE